MYKRNNKLFVSLWGLEQQQWEALLVQISLGRKLMSFVPINPLILIWSNNLWGSLWLMCVLSAAKPHWIQPIKDVEVAVEDTLYWDCRASGKPKPSYRWLKNGEQLAIEVTFCFENLVLCKINSAHANRRIHRSCGIRGEIFDTGFVFFESILMRLLELRRQIMLYKNTPAKSRLKSNNRTTERNT